VSLRRLVPAAVRRHPAWRTASRLHHEGWLTARRRVRTWRRILVSAPTVTNPLTPGTPIEVHLMCYRLDHLAAIWALKSFYRAAGVRFPLVIHLQGRTPARVRRRLQHHFPAARVVSQNEADREVETALTQRRLHRLLTTRRNNPMIMKLTDFVLIGSSVHVLALDSDVLFFERPDELLPAGTDPMRETVFMHDLGSSYNVTETEAREQFGIRLVPQINCGVMLFARERLDLSRCDALLDYRGVNSNTGLAEQTLRALIASEEGTVTFLPQRYRLSFQTVGGLDGAVMRHYAGGSRYLFTKEGVARLIERGFLERET